MLRIGSLELKQPTLLAPMAALTDAAFRALVDETGGCGLLVSEMIAAEGLRRRNRRTLEMLGDFRGRTPQFIQLFGADPQGLADAARLIEAETGFAGIDFNMGCPVAKVMRNGSGAALLGDLPRAADCIAALRRAVKLPLSVKIRLGIGKVTVADTLRAVQEAGADAVTVHFRLAQDPFSRPARWELASQIRSLLRVPLIGNGDIHDVQAAFARLQEVDGVAIGRGALADPFLFARIAGEEVPPERYSAMAARLCELIEAHARERLRLSRLKAYLRYLSFGGSLTRPLKKPVFLATDYADAKRKFIGLVSILFGSTAGS